jgi:hypothetical protein
MTKQQYLAPTKLADKEFKIEITSAFSLRNLKLASLVNEIFILPLFKTCAKVINPGVLALANKLENKIQKETSPNQTSYQNKMKVSNPTKCFKLIRIKGIRDTTNFQKEDNLPVV